jgi:hypothetical protein
MHNRSWATAAEKSMARAGEIGVVGRAGLADAHPQPHPIAIAMCIPRLPAFGALFFAVLFLVSAPATADESARLRIFNASGQTVEVFPAGDAAEPRSVIEPGKDEIFSTELGRRFRLGGREDGHESAVVSEVPHQAFWFDPSGRDGIPDFYTRIVRMRGFPIVASENVNPYALKEALYIGESMLGKRPDVVDAMVRSGARLSIIAHNEYTTDLPEFAWFGREPVNGFEQFSGKDFWDARARGTGGSSTDPHCSCGEENLLGYPGDPYASENILIHEFAHNIHLRGLNNLDPTFDDRLRETYENAMAEGRWKGKYASVNHYEYFAEGVQSWFDDNRENDHDHNHVNTRIELIEYDPDLASLCREVFGRTEFTYTKPETRLHGHLEGYDPSAAPTFAWPERLLAVKEAIRENARARGTEQDDDEEEEDG